MFMQSYFHRIFESCVTNTATLRYSNNYVAL